MGLGIYIHLPFCRQKCFYCDFPSYAGLSDLYPSYIAALCQEIAAQGGLLAGAAADSVYIGGGTPTVLPSALLGVLIGALRQSFALTAAAEFTIEANPGTVDAETLFLLRQAGVNRISFGVQSFEDDLLRGIGRVHTASQAKAAIVAARQAGFDNISLDLMYGLPRQTMQNLTHSVQMAIALGVRHISVYGLQVEPDTVFAARQAEGLLALPDAEIENEMYEFLMDTLPSQGYQRYEISNFAQTGFESRHNLKYWQDAPYIGLGAAAHSYQGNRRYHNVREVQTYIAYLNEGKSPQAEEIILTESDRMEEFCFLALRTRQGISPERFSEKFNCDFFSVYGQTVAALCRQGLIEVAASAVYLTKRGMKYGNPAFAEFLLK